MASFNGIEIFFLICAVAGGFFVMVKMILQLIGGEMHADLHDNLAIDAHHADSDIGFSLLSLHGMSSFLMMFGLVGVALYRQGRVGLSISLVGATLAGLGTVWVIGKLFQLFGRMQSSGTLPATVGALASTGTVYMTIPKGGTGRVTINIRNRLRELDAVESHGGELPTGTAVQVIDVTGNVVVVKSLGNQ